MKTDIVLVKPGSQKSLYGSLSEFQLTAIEPPLWGAILAAYLESKGYSVILLDAEAENWGYQEAAEQVASIDPILACVVVSGSNPSASTMNMTGAGQIITLIKEQNGEIQTLLAGLHPSALPERTVREEAADFVCQGEGFYTIPSLIDALKSRVKDYSIPGLWYQRGGEVISNPRPPILENLDEVPQPAWQKLPMEKYRAHNWHCFDDIQHRQPYGVLYTSLGCPFKCSFCCINALFGKNTIRYRSTDSVVREIDFLVNEYGIRHIKIIDEMFAMNERRVIELCDRIIERKYNLNMWAYARVNTVTEKMLVRMKQAGINWLAYGFESGSKRVIESVTKGYDVSSVERIVKLSYDLGFYICANYIFGLPEDDYDSMNETLELMFRINAEWANIYSAMAYPGSHLYRDALAQELPLPEQWHGFSQYSYEALPLPSKYLTGGQILAFRDYAFDAYYSNPRYLNMMEKKFGSAVSSHILDMASNKLERKHSNYLAE
ncbi:MAG: cobalamin B12-binding domain-containing protein [Phycisphaeraceae bacterium]|nr:cobalamin B12-binding domain-containing protein [Phycisphaeraceae bacterium]